MALNDAHRELLIDLIITHAEDRADELLLLFQEISDSKLIEPLEFLERAEVRYLKVSGWTIRSDGAWNPPPIPEEHRSRLRYRNYVRPLALRLQRCVDGSNGKLALTIADIVVPPDVINRVNACALNPGRIGVSVRTALENAAMFAERDLLLRAGWDLTGLSYALPPPQSVIDDFALSNYVP